MTRSSIHEATRARLQALSTGAGDRARPRAQASGDVHQMWIYEPISDWWGISAGMVVEELKDVTASTIELHLNSPGGDVFDGIAIKNALQQHSARIEVHVDGLAASIASVIAMAGDEIVMHPGAQLMIHDASGLCWGNAADMRQMGDELDHISASIAALYARRGGTVAEWREAMLAESWYDAEEAVAAGLADRVAEDTSSTDTATAKAQNRWDLSMFAHQGRTNAPAPPVLTGDRTHLQVAAIATHGRPDLPDPTGPGSPTPGSSGDTQEGSTIVDFSDEQLTTLRQRVGVPVDADADTILAALAECLEERADAPAPQAQTGPPEGMVLLEEQQYQQLLDNAAAGREARDQQVSEHRAQLVTAAISDGRIPRARRDHWLTALEADPEGNEALLASLAPGLVNVTERGHSSPSGAGDDDPVYAAMYGEEEN